MKSFTNLKKILVGTLLIFFTFGFAACPGPDGGGDKTIDTRLVGEWDFGTAKLRFVETRDPNTTAARGWFTPIGGSAPISFDWEVTGTARTDGNVTLNLNFFRPATENIDAVVRVTFVSENSFMFENIGFGGRSPLNDALDVVSDETFVKLVVGELITFEVLTPNLALNTIDELVLRFSAPVTRPLEDFEDILVETFPVETVADVKVGRISNTELGVTFTALSDMTPTIPNRSVTVTLDGISGINNTPVTISRTLFVPASTSDIDIDDEVTKGGFITLPATANAPVTNRNITWSIHSIAGTASQVTLNNTNRQLSVATPSDVTKIVLRGIITNGLERNKDFNETFDIEVK